eukprot:CAMPEP_0185783392 /NCGR_PEP_ID=MMETSP1174-20130828/116539_1 /TAXON_ID=35687 /ORGANISM="Dictyocha speculum, Strain CCMP1381" /LENGTH=70 /DNA_ID=CAMNT_0028474411 /DNA_START=20 /DNA_END=228 /DNA_ORIENTATION=-
MLGYRDEPLRGGIPDPRLRRVRACSLGHPRPQTRKYNDCGAPGRRGSAQSRNSCKMDMAGAMPVRPDLSS